MRRRRRLWIILLATPLVLLAADTAGWWTATRYLARGLAAWEAERSAAGWIDQHGPPRRGGWPFAATLTVPAIGVSGDGADIGQRPAWHADRLVLRLSLARPGSQAIAAEGRQLLRLAGITVPFSANRLLLTLPVRSEPWPGSMDLIADDLHADTPLGGEAAVESLRLHLDFGPKAQSGDPALGFSLQAEGINLPAGIIRPLGPRIASFAVDGAATGPVPAGRTPAEQAAAWRDGGGSLEIRHLAMVWGPLDLTATATLALDDQLQPMGAGSAHLVGYTATLDALAAHAAISRSAAIATKAVLSLMAHNPEDGSPPDVEVPLTLQYRTLSMRQVPLVRLPELDWP